MPDQETVEPINPYPVRRRLRHEVPAWVNSGVGYFITICCVERERNQLCHTELFEVMAGAVEYYVKQCRWWVDVGLAMPDHWHALMSFPRQEQMHEIVRDWKRYVARKTGVKWQDGFFDHRLRSDESADDKYRYITENPVRRGLCARTGDWPWVWYPQ